MAYLYSHVASDMNVLCLVFARITNFGSLVITGSPVSVQSRFIVFVIDIIGSSHTFVRQRSVPVLATRCVANLAQSFVFHLTLLLINFGFDTHFETIQNVICRLQVLRLR